MSYIERHSVAITNSTTGGGTTYTRPITGTVESIELAAGLSSATLTLQTTRGQTIWAEATVASTAYVSRFPRQQTHTTTGGALLFSTTGGDAVIGKSVLARDRIQITVSSGTSGETANISVLVS